MLGLSPSRYYYWLKRAPSDHTCRDAALKARILAIYVENRQVYAGPRSTPSSATRENGSVRSEWVC